MDDSFPPIPKSLYVDPNKDDQRQVQWLRPQQISVAPGDSAVPWQVFRTPLPSDITQGVLGDCWCVARFLLVRDWSNVAEKVISDNAQFRTRVSCESLLARNKEDSSHM